jgi:hypothetical protein
MYHKVQGMASRDFEHLIFSPSKYPNGVEAQLLLLFKTLGEFLKTSNPSTNFKFMQEVTGCVFLV